MKMQQCAALEDQIQVMYGETTEYENLKDAKVRITIVGVASLKEIRLLEIAKVLSIELVDKVVLQPSR